MTVMNVSGEEPVESVQVKVERKDCDSCILCGEGLCEGDYNVNLRCSECAHLPAAHHVDCEESGRGMIGVVQIWPRKGWRTVRVGRAK